MTLAENSIHDAMDCWKLSTVDLKGTYFELCPLDILNHLQKFAVPTRMELTAMVVVVGQEGPYNIGIRFRGAKQYEKTVEFPVPPVAFVRSLPLGSLSSSNVDELNDNHPWAKVYFRPWNHYKLHGWNHYAMDSLRRRVVYMEHGYEVFIVSGRMIV